MLVYLCSDVRRAQKMAVNLPDWFRISEEVTPDVMRRVANAVSSNAMSLQVKMVPTLAHWFILDSLLLANQANRKGMHANALSLTRQCVEAIGVIELGVCGHPDAEEILLKWNEDKITPGKLRGWLENNVWKNYGNGLWDEPWSIFMREFASATQPYAHYNRNLAQWQLKLHQISNSGNGPGNDRVALVEVKPRAYDPQKATRITLYHAIFSYILGRILIVASCGDSNFSIKISMFGQALGNSRYLDGHMSDWGQQFWAMLWNQNGGPILE
jgi:hypothetical protein